MIGRPIPFVTLARPERIDAPAYSTNSVIRIGGGGLLPNDRWYFGLIVTWEGRITMPASGGPSAFTADGLPALIERFTVQGFHRPRAQNQTFFDLRGADAYVLAQLYTGLAGFVEPASFSFGASATNDVRVYYFLPFTPLQIGPIEASRYLLDAPNYDALQFAIQTGDLASVFASFTTAPTLSAFGSATGSPIVRVSGYFAQAGPGKFIGQLPGRTFYSFQEYTDSRITSSGTAVRLHDIVRGNYVRGLVLKTGVKKTGVTAGNNAYSTLSDWMLSNIRVFRGVNTLIRDYPLYRDIKEEQVVSAAISGANQPVRAPTGYAHLEFAKHGLLAESMNATGLVAGPTGSVDFYLAADVVGAANQGLVVITEEIRWLPGQQ